MIAHLRNKLTGEITETEQDSQEFVDLVAERDGDGFPVYEQTGRHHAAAVETRRESDTLQDEDLGKEQENSGAIVYDKSNLTEVAPSDLDLTLAEVEAGLTPEAKADELNSQYGIARSGFASDAPHDHGPKARKVAAKRRGKNATSGRAGTPTGEKEQEKAPAAAGSGSSGPGS